MNLLSVLKSLFKSRPSLEEFIAAHEPTDVFQVEELERRYWELDRSSAWLT